MESFEYMGYWWLPGEPNEPISEIPERAIPGKLSFDPATGGELELLGKVDTDVFDIIGNTFDIIQGHSHESGQCITLYNSYVYTESHTIGLYDPCKLFVDYIFVGGQYWFDSKEDINFESMTVSYLHLNSWMSQNRFDIDVSRIDYARKSEYSVSYTSPDPIEIQVDDTTIELWAFSGTRSSISEVSLSNDYRFTISPQEALSLFEYLAYINFHLPYFLTLATSHPIIPINVTALISGERRGVSIYFRVPQVEEHQSISPWRMLFSFNDVQDELPKYMSKWISISETVKATVELYFRSQYSKVLDLDEGFLDLAQALEAYHRNTHGGEYLTDEEYEPIKSALVDAIPKCVEKSHRHALEGRLQYGNQYSLRKRLNELCCESLAEQKNDVEKLLKNPSDFIHKVVETRNYLTHRDEQNRKGALDHGALYEHYRRMKMLVQICFLKEMDFPPNEITRLLNANQEYQHLIKVKSA